MTTEDFKLLSTLPSQYDYEICFLNGKKAVIGKLHESIIGFFIVDEKLVSIIFQESTGIR